ncbi:MAG: DUF2461 domain-containing protein [Spirochaetota bacterium]
MTTADLKFLNALSRNNNREWFQAHKDEYTRANENFLHLVGAFIFGMADIDESIAGVEPASCLFRIYRDVRFSKNKAPYKNHLGAFISRAGRKGFNTPGYYLHIEPGGKSVFGSGLYMPDKDRLAAIRREISTPMSKVAAVFADKKVRAAFPQVLEDDKVARVPRGFDAASPHAELLKLRHFSVYTHLGDEEVTGKMLVKQLLKKAPLLKQFNTVLERAAR